MEVYRIDRDAPEREPLVAAAEAVLRGGVIAYPSDTLYGLGCSLFDVSAVEMMERPTRSRRFFVGGKSFRSSSYVGMLPVVAVTAERREFGGK